MHLDRRRGPAMDDRVGDEFADQQRGVLADRRRQLRRRAEVADELAGLARGVGARRQAKLGRLYDMNSRGDRVRGNLAAALDRAIKAEGGAK